MQLSTVGKLDLMRLCPACNASVAEGKVFCTTCGARMPTAPVAASSSTPQPTAAVVPVPIDAVLPVEKPTRLYVHSGLDRGRFFPLIGPRTVIGRSRDADIQLSDALVSSRHAVLVQTGPRYTIEDLGSANGTILDGQRLKPGYAISISHGVLVELGDSIIELVAAGAEPRPATPTVLRSARQGSRLSRRTKILSGIAGVALIALITTILVVSNGDNPPPSALPSSAQSHDAAWVMQQEDKTTVQVFACDNSSKARCDATGSAGSGSVIDLDAGLILTNFHVIANDSASTLIPHLWVAISISGEDYKQSRVVGFSACDDLALIRVTDDVSSFNLEQVEFADPPSVQIGEGVVVLGYPGTIAQTASGDVALQLTTGSVSALNVRFENYVDLIQTDAPINHGNSGGPMFDLDGRQIGVATLNDDESTQGIHYAISVAQVQKALPDLKSGTKQTGLSACPD